MHGSAQESLDALDAHLCYEPGEQGVRGDVEGHSQSQIAGSLVHLATELPLRHMKLHNEEKACSDIVLIGCSPHLAYMIIYTHELGAVPGKA